MAPPAPPGYTPPMARSGGPRSVQEVLDEAPVQGGRLRTGMLHFVLRASWGRLLLTYVVIYLGTNALFAIGYALVGGIANARPGSLVDGFWFSVQILGTGGDSAMSSVGTGAHVLVVVETMLAVLLLGLIGGVTYAKLSVPGLRVRFSAPAVVFVFDGVPTLAFRVGNQRRELVVGVDVTLVGERPEVSAEGHRIWRTYDLRLRRSHFPTLARGYSVMHPLDAQSPLQGYTPERLAAEDWALEASLTGTDSLSGQLVHASAAWEPRDLRWGHRLADTFIPVPGGSALLDLRHFDETVPCAPSEGFPYPTRGPDALRRARDSIER
jgi:inward rectifier potassium channel